jgi:bacteriocin biosynthesis cyclodehydratase domain-containing protein
MLKGKSLYPLLEHLIPHLNGNVTIEELTRGLDTDRKRMITNLIEKLFAHEFLMDISQDQPSTLLPEERETYASNLAFIEFFQTSAAYRFECFRNKHLLILGCGLGFTSLVRASLQCGVRQISAIVMPEDETGSISCQDFLASCVSSEQTVQLIKDPCWDNEAEVRNTIQAYDAVLHISERPMVARAQLLNRLCVEEQKTFIQAIIVGDHAWIGPLVCAEAEGCWECAWRRLQANLTDFSEQLSHYEFHNQPESSNSRFLARPEATMIANRLIFALFKYFTQTGSAETKGHLSVIHLETGLSENHAFLPHPYCQACQHPVVPTASQFLERIQQLQYQSPIDRDSFLERIADGAIDARLGLFTAIENDNFVRAPLAIYEAHVSNPMLQKDRSLDITAASINTEETRLRAFQEACTRYAANLVDRRRLFSREALQQHTFPALSADQLIGMPSFPGQNQYKMWTWALDLQTQQACIVPAEQVFSTLHTQDQGTESERGIASGMSWEEAICRALLDWCNYLTVEHLKDAQQAYFQVDLDRTLLTPEGRYLYHLLKAAVGQKIIVYDVTGLLHVPTFATCFGEKVVAYSTHCDEAQALRMGFERALQQYQAEQCQQFEYAVAPVPDFPSALRSAQLSVPRYTLPDTWPARQEWLLQRLQANGLRALAVPLDHDPALAEVLPFIARVLLSKAESKKGE